jgi:hypothetical protein
MAYQHFWSNIRHIPEAKFALMISDFNLCLAPLQAMGVSLADGVGEGSPLIGPEAVRFNGLWHCGHIKNEAIKVPIPADDAAGVGSSLDAIVEPYGYRERSIPDDPDSHLGVIVRHRCCNGTCSFETFEVERDDSGEPFTPPPSGWPDRSEADEALMHDRDPNWTGGSCKTAYRPYDLAVQCFLVIAKHHLREKFMVRSDGLDLHWHEAYDLCHEVLGYPRREFQIVELESGMSNMFPIAHLAATGPNSQKTR